MALLPAEVNWSLSPLIYFSCSESLSANILEAGLPEQSENPNLTTLSIDLYPFDMGNTHSTGSKPKRHHGQFSFPDLTPFKSVENTEERTLHAQSELEKKRANLEQDWRRSSEGESRDEVCRANNWDKTKGVIKK